MWGCRGFHRLGWMYSIRFQELPAFPAGHRSNQEWSDVNRKPLVGAILLLWSQHLFLIPFWSPQIQEVNWPRMNPKRALIFTLGALSSSAAMLPSVFFPEHQTILCGNRSSMTACTLVPPSKPAQIKTSAPWRFGNLNAWKRLSAYSSLPSQCRKWVQNQI